MAKKLYMLYVVILMFAMTSTAIHLFRPRELVRASDHSGKPEQSWLSESVSFGAMSRPDLRHEEEAIPVYTAFSENTEKIIPCVVSIIPTRIDTQNILNNPYYRSFRNRDKDRGFLQFNFGLPETKESTEGDYYIHGLGSGVIVSRKGHILTCYHVIEGATEIDVSLHDERSFKAHIVGVDSLSDLAVLIMDKAPDDLPVAYLGNSDSLRLGEWVLAVGTPFLLKSSVTAGIVSAVGRRVGAATTVYQDFIQTDAAINIGNSGGALVNKRGELVGVNAMILSQSGGNLGIGFAIPINMARWIMSELVTKGAVSRGAIGVITQSLTTAMRRALDIEQLRRGVLVADILKDQPAYRAGLTRGDIIMAVDGKQIQDCNHLNNLIASRRPGEKTVVTVVRAGKETEVTVNVARQRTDGPELKAVSQEQNFFVPNTIIKNRSGMRTENLSSHLRRKFNIADYIVGVVITRVQSSFTDIRTDLLPGDVILRCKRCHSSEQDIRSVQDYKTVMQQAKSGDELLMLVQRGESTFYRVFVMGDQADR